MELNPVGKISERYYGNLDVPDGGYVGDADGSPLIRFDLTNGVLEITGNLRFMSSASGIISGSMYTNNWPIAVALTNQDEWYEWVDASNPWTEGLTNGITFDDPGLVIVTPGRYEILWAVSTDFSATPGASQEIEYGIAIDGAIQSPGQAHRTLANSTDTGHCSGFAQIDLSAGEKVSLAAMNESSAGKTLHVEHGNVILTHIGGI